MEPCYCSLNTDVPIGFCKNDGQNCQVCEPEGALTQDADCPKLPSMCRDV